MGTWSRFPDRDPPREAVSLAELVERDGGRALSLYQEPVGGHWQIFCLLPVEKVEPTPYQRDISPTHVKRLLEVVRKLDRFVDPVVAVSPRQGLYWTPNGNHRRAVLERLKAKFVPAILVPEPDVAFQILALNTEKAHNLKEKSLEVIRMHRALAEAEPKSTEVDFAFQLESPHFITLGLLYERKPRFAGGAFAPILKRVDKFLKSPLTRAQEERKERAALVDHTDDLLTGIVVKARKRGIRHPYLKSFILTRATPLTRARKTLPSFEDTFKKLSDNLEKFDVAKISYEEIVRSALIAGEAGG